MNGQTQTQESSLTSAFAELERLEFERADFAAGKARAHEQAALQGEALASLRARLEAERPRARARVQARRDRERARSDRRQALEQARVAAEHEQNMAQRAADLEATRRRLATLQASVEVVRPARRIFEWSMPVAAAGLVMMLGMSVLHEGAAVAGSAEASASFPSLGAETEIVVAADAAPVVPLMQPLPPAPEVVAVPEPAPKSKSSKSKTSKSKTSSSKTSSSKSSSDDSKRKNPLILGDFDGNPLG